MFSSPQNRRRLGQSLCLCDEEEAGLDSSDCSPDDEGVVKGKKEDPSASGMSFSAVSFPVWVMVVRRMGTPETSF